MKVSSEKVHLSKISKLVAIGILVIASTVSAQINGGDSPVAEIISNNFDPALSNYVSQEQIIPFGKGSFIATWTQQRTGNTVDGSTIQSSVFTKGEGWTEPIRVDTSRDYYKIRASWPLVYAQGNKAFVFWKEYSRNSNFCQSYYCYTEHFAVISDHYPMPETGRFVPIANNSSERPYVVFDSNNQAYALFTDIQREYLVGKPYFGTSTIYYSKFENGRWAARKPLYRSNNYLKIEEATTNKDGSFSVVYKEVQGKLFEQRLAGGSPTMVGGPSSGTATVYVHNFNFNGMSSATKASVLTSDEIFGEGYYNPVNTIRVLSSETAKNGTKYLALDRWEKHPTYANYHKTRTYLAKQKDATSWFPAIKFHPYSDSISNPWDIHFLTRGAETLALFNQSCSIIAGNGQSGNCVFYSKSEANGNWSAVKSIAPKDSFFSDASMFSLASESEGSSYVFFKKTMGPDLLIWSKSYEGNDSWGVPARIELAEAPAGASESPTIAPGSHPSVVSDEKSIATLFLQPLTFRDANGRYNSRQVLRASVIDASGETDTELPTNPGEPEDAMAHTIFVTNTVFPVESIQGLSGADRICQQAAGSSPYPAVSNNRGNFYAVLSDSRTNAKDRLALSSGTLKTPSGRLVLSSANEFWNGRWRTNVNETEYGSQQTRSNFAFTGTRGNGTKADETAGSTHCNDWTATSISPIAIGSLFLADARAIDSSNGGTFNSSCKNRLPIYCLSTTKSPDVMPEPTPEPEPESPTTPGDYTLEKHIAFVTSTNYRVDEIKGLSGADALCQKHAAQANLEHPYSFKAILSDSKTNAKDRIKLTNKPVVSLNGAIVVTEGPKLWSQVWRTGIFIDEKNSRHYGRLIWTGTKEDGTKALTDYQRNFCGDWTSNNSRSYTSAGYAGGTYRIGLDVRLGSPGVQTCGGDLSLYCVQSAK